MIFLPKSIIKIQFVYLTIIKKIIRTKKRQIQYLKLLEQQTKVCDQNIKNLDEQTQKEKKIKEG